MSSKQQSAVFAATTCAMAACVAISSAALRQRRLNAMMSHNETEETTDSTEADNKGTLSEEQNIWRSADGDDGEETQGMITIQPAESIDSLNSLDSPLAWAPTETTSVNIATAKQPEESEGDHWGWKDFTMIMAWVFLFMLKIPSSKVHEAAVPVPRASRHGNQSLAEFEMPACLLYDELVTIDEGFYGLHMGNQSADAIVMATKSLQDISFSEMRGVYGPFVVDAPYEIEMNFEAPPLLESIKTVQKNLASDPVEVSEGVYGPLVANVSRFSAIQSVVQNFLNEKPTPLQEGVYGPYVLDAPFEFELKTESLGLSTLYQKLADHRITVAQGVYGPFLADTMDMIQRKLSARKMSVPQGTYGPYVADTPERMVEMASQRNSVLDGDVGGVYGHYVGAGPSLPKEMLREFSELQHEWADQGMCRV